MIGVIGDGYHASPSCLIWSWFCPNGILCSRGRRLVCKARQVSGVENRLAQRAQMPHAFMCFVFPRLILWNKQVKPNT